MRQSELEGLLRSLEWEQEISRRSILRAFGYGAVGAPLAGLLAACGGGSQASPQSSNSPAFKLGVIQALTGALAASYKTLYVPLNIAIQEMNATGGIMGRKIETSVVDDQGTAANEPAAARQLLDETKYIIGPTGSSLVLAGLEVSQKDKVIQCGFGGDVVFADPAKYPGNFQLLRSTTQEATILSKWALQTGSKKIGVMYENTAYGQAAGPLTVDKLTGGGAKPVLVDVYQSLSASFAANVTRMKAANADTVIMLSANVNDTLKILQAMIQAQYQPTAAGSSTFLMDLIPNNKDFAPFLNKLAVWTYRSLAWSPGKPVGPKQQAYIKKVLANPDTGTNRYTVMQGPFYDFMYILKHAVESARSFDYAKVKKAMEDPKGYDGILGHLVFSATDHHGISDDQLSVGFITDMTAPESLGILPKLAT